VPAVGRAQRHVDPPNAKPRLSAPYRSVDVRPVPVLVAPDTSAIRADHAGRALRGQQKVHAERAAATGDVDEPVDEVR
jgi:hypothetical protein